MGCKPSKSARKPLDNKKHSVLAAPPPRPPEMLRTPIQPTPERVRPAGPLVDIPMADDLVSAPSAQPPQFEETSKERQEEQRSSYQKEMKGKEKSKSQNLQMSRDTSSFQWPTAHEVKQEKQEKREKKRVVMKTSSTQEEADTRKAERAAYDKAAFLAECKRAKDQRRMSSVDEEDDDTLYEQPTRIPNMDFVTDSTLIL